MLRAIVALLVLTSSAVIAAEDLRGAAVLAALDWTRPELAPVAAAWKERGQPAAVKAFAAYLRERKNVHWQENSDGSEKVIPRFKKEAAEAAAEGKLEGGMKPAHPFPNGDVDWHFDATAATPGYIQNNEWQWQLNRMGFWTDLSGGYIATGDEKYARAFVKQMRSWIDQCPAPDHVDNVKGSSWRSIEAGIRMGWNWPTAFFSFVHSPSVSDEDLIVMVSSFVDHARYLRTCYTRLNFLTMEMNGLYAVGTVFPEMRDAKEWREFAMNTLAEEGRRQFLADGAQAELSTGYQNVAMDNILKIYEMARWNQREGEIPQGYLASMEKGYDWQMGILAPTYSTARFNDSWESPNILRRASRFFPKRDDFRWFATEGKEGKAPSWTSVFWDCSGFAAMRSGWDHQANTLIFRVGPAGAGHQHQDSLNVVLWSYGRELLFYTGGGNYDGSKWRKWGISTYAHNCLIVDGMDQTRTFNWNDPMHDPNMVSQKPIDARWKSTPVFDYATGVYDQGYGPKHVRVAKQRRDVLYLKPDLYVVADRIAPADDQSHQYQTRWNLLSTQTQIDPATKVLVTTDSGVPNLAIVPLLLDQLEVRSASGQENPELLGWDLHKGSEAFQRTPATTLVHTRSGAGPQTMLTLLAPLRVGQASPILKVEPGADGRSSTVFLTSGAILWISCAGEQGIEVRETLPGGAGAPGRIAQPEPLSTANDEGPATSEVQALEELNLDAPGMKDVKAAVQSHSVASIKNAYLQYRRTLCPAKWTVSPESKPKTPKAETDAAGDALCDHIINDSYKLFPDPVDMGKDFNWTHNPRPSSDPAYTQEWTWASIGRTQFWNRLADAYWNTLNEKYASEWVAQMLDFSRKNNRRHILVPGEASLWRTLDASERAAESWPYSYYHFLNSPAFTPEAQWVYLRMMIDHAEHLKEGLQLPGRKGNWVASECFGLYTIGVLFPELKAAEGWRQYALDRLTEEMNCSVPPDGFEAELTPGYHYFSLSSFAGPLKLAKLNSLSVPDIFRSKILSMYQAPVLVMDQGGNIVPTNDSWYHNAAKDARKGLELLGDDPLLLWAATDGKKGTAPAASTMLPYAGFYAMRGGWKPNDLFLFFRAGPAGFAHDHQDMLEVVLKAWNKSLLLDPGTYRYDHSDWRRYAIGTASHNTVIVDDKWQRREANKPPVPQCNNPWVATPLFDYVSGRYDEGYQKNVYNSSKQYAPQDWVGAKDYSVSHTRHVVFLKPYYVILLDTLDGIGTHQYEAHFHLDSPSARVDSKTQAVISENAKEQGQLAIFPLDRQGLDVKIVQGQKDPLLGWVPEQHRAIPTACYQKTQQAPALFATLLHPFKDKEPSIESAPLNVNSDDFWATSLNTAREKAEIIIAKDDQAHLWRADSKLSGSIQTKSSGMVIRRLAASAKTLVGCWKIDSYNDPQWSFKVSQPGTLVWSVQDQTMLVQNADASAPVQIKIGRPFVQDVTLPPGEWVAISKEGAKSSASPLDDLKPLDETAH